MGKRYLLHCAVAHPEFRLPDLQSVSELFGFESEMKLSEKEEDRDPNRPFLIVELEQEEHARQLAKRCVLIKAVYELWADADSYEELHRINKTNEAMWSGLGNESFRFSITATGHTIPNARKDKIIEDFSYMAYTGKIDIKNASLNMAYFEEYSRRGILRDRVQGDGQFLRAYFGRLIEEGDVRHLICKFDVKQRVYYGNTSMDAEVSLIMANQALASPGKLIYDPFVGTGSMLYTAAYFGALVLGSDIDGRQMRGKNLTTPGIFQSASQYGVTDRILDCCTFDITKSPFRIGNFLDAIVSDPPYGVRAGAKRLGCTEGKPIPAPLPPGETPRSISTYPKMPYELSELTIDLVLLARHLLKPNGRLVWFLPTPTEEYQDVDIPTCHGMELVANSEQNFGKWGRRLITMRKCSTENFPPPSFDPAKRLEELGVQNPILAGHKNFRSKYFARFKNSKKNDMTS